MSKLARLLAVLSALQAGRTVPATELARRVGVTERTLRRDVAELREEGYRIDAGPGPGGGYTLMRGTRLPPLLFDEQQVLALAIALQAMPRVGGVEDGAQRALTSLRQLLPSKLAAVVDRHQLHSEPAVQTDEVDAATLARLADAMTRHLVIAFDYQKLGADQAERRRVEPHHVLFSSGRWYLIAWDLDRDHWRTFRLDRLQLTGMTGPQFARRTLPLPPAEFLHQTLEETHWPCTGTVRLHASLDFVTRWAHPGWIIESQGPDRVRVTASAWTWGGLIGWMSTYDVPFEVESPEELRTAALEVSDRLRRAAQHTDESLVRDYDDVPADAERTTPVDFPVRTL